MIRFLEKTAEVSTLTLVGDVRLFLEGRISKEKLESVDALDFKFALGGATLNSLEEVGEAMIIHQNAFVSRLSQRGSLKCLSRRAPISPFFLVGVDPHQKYSALIEMEGEQSLALFYRELLSYYPDGFLIAGEALFPKLEGAYVHRCPKEGISPMKEFDAYLGEEKRGYSLGYVVALVFDKEHGHIPADILGRIFYESPKQKGSLPFHSHSHVALINERDRGAIDIERDVCGIRHLYNSSTISYGRFFIYKISA